MPSTILLFSSFKYILFEQAISLVRTWKLAIVCVILCNPLLLFLLLLLLLLLLFFFFLFHLLHILFIFLLFFFLFSNPLRFVLINYSFIVFLLLLFLFLLLSFLFFFFFFPLLLLLSLSLLIYNRPSSAVLVSTQRCETLNTTRLLSLKINDHL